MGSYSNTSLTPSASVAKLGFTDKSVRRKTCTNSLYWLRKSLSHNHKANSIIIVQVTRVLGVEPQSKDSLVLSIRSRNCLLLSQTFARTTIEVTGTFSFALHTLGPQAHSTFPMSHHNPHTSRSVVNKLSSQTLVNTRIK